MTIKTRKFRSKLRKYRHTFKNTKINKFVKNNFIKKKFTNVSQTYVANFNYFKAQILGDLRLKLILNKLSIRLSTNNYQKHLFGFNIDSRYYNTKFVMLNRFVNISDVTDKAKLFFNCKYYFPLSYDKYLANSYPFMYDTTINWKENKTYLAKSVGGRSGIGIYYIYDNKTLTFAKQQIKKIPGGFILSEYIDKPLLFKGIKMHLRAYVLFTLIDNEFNTYLLNYGRIYTAKLPFVLDKFNNKLIHDTHLKSTFGMFYFPRDLIKYKSIPNMKAYNQIYENMRNALNMVSRIAVMNFDKYNNSDNGYSIYGIDYIVEENYNVKLLEINSNQTGYCGYNVPECAEFNRIIWDWIAECVIYPTIYNNYQPNKNNISNVPITSFKIAGNY